jgi:hypothetical protein
MQYSIKCVDNFSFATTFYTLPLVHASNEQPADEQKLSKSQLAGAESVGFSDKNEPTKSQPTHASQFFGTPRRFPGVGRVGSRKVPAAWTDFQIFSFLGFIAHTHHSTHQRAKHTKKPDV